MSRRVDFAAESGNQQVDPEHVFYALLRQEDSIIANVLDKLGIPNAFKEAKALKDEFVSGGHILLALLLDNGKDKEEKIVFRDGETRNISI